MCCSPISVVPAAGLQPNGQAHIDRPSGHGDGRRDLPYQLLPLQFSSDGPETDVLGHLADTQQRYPLTVDPAAAQQDLHLVAASIMLCDHVEASGPAVHSVMLAIIEKLDHIEIDLYEVIVRSD
nr:hypothetical protein [Rhodohalobacter sulfatireducens]